MKMDLVGFTYSVGASKLLVLLKDGLSSGVQELSEDEVI